MKKFLVVWLSALCVICTAVFLTACTGKTEQLDGEYKPEYHKVFTDECDTFMNIDGKLDEDEWKNKKYLTNSYVVPDLNNDATVYYTVHMTEKGLYVGSYTDDTSFTYNRPFSDSNSNWKIYVAPVTQTENNQAYVKSFQIDYKTVRSMQGARVSSAVYVEGEVNSGKTVKASMEMFVSWDQLNIDVSETANGYPEQIGIYAIYKLIPNLTGTESRVISTAFTSTSKPSMYYVFDNSGYLNVDGENAALGDAYSGYAKTNGWDVSRVSEGQVESVRNNVQIIWFKNAYSAVWAAEVKISPVDDIMDSGPKVGMIALSDTNNFRAFLLNAADSNLTESDGVRNFDRCHMFGLTYFPSKTWTMSALGVDSSIDMDLYSDCCVMKVVKENDKMYYFINDTFVYSESCVYINGSVYAGIISIGFDAIFSDFSFTDYTGKEADLSEQLSGMARINVTNGIGGTTLADKIAVKSGGSVTLMTDVSQGYEISSITANGTDITDTIREIAQGNKYIADGSCVITPVTEDTLFEVNYAPLENKSQVLLSLKDENGNALSGNAVIYSPEDPLIRYELRIDEDGARCILPSDKGELKVLVITDNSESVIASVDPKLAECVLQLEKPVIGGDYDYDDYSVTSSHKGWDYLFQSEGTVYADKNANGGYAYFGDSYDETAVIKMTINKSLSAEEWLFAGIVMSNATNKVEMGVQGQKLRYYEGSSSDYTDIPDVFESTLYGTEQKSITLTIIRNNGKISVYENIGGREKLAYETDDLMTGKAAYGLTIRANNDVNVEFTDLTILTGAEAKQEIESNYTPGFFGAVSTGVTVNEENKSAVLPTASSAAYAYFTETSKNPHSAVVETVISSNNTLWATIGFVMKSGSDEAYFGLYANRFKVVLNGTVTYQGTGAVFDARAHMAMSDVKIKMFRSGETVYLLEDSGNGFVVKVEMSFAEMFADKYIDGMFGAETYYGVGVRGTNAEVTFDAIRYITGDEAASEIAEDTVKPFFGASGNATADEQSKTVTVPAISSGYAYADFTETDSDKKAVISFTVNYDGNGWPVIGFTMSCGDNKAYIGIFATRLRTELNGSDADKAKDHSGVFTADTRNGLQSVRIMMIRSGDTVTILEYADNSWQVKKTLSLSELFASVYTDGMFDGEVTYGLGVRGSNGETVFSSIEYETGDDAQKIIDEVLTPATV